MHGKKSVKMTIQNEHNSGQYSRCRYTFIAPETPKWRGMLAIFDYLTWASFCLVLIISAVAWFLLGHATHEARSMRQFGLCALNTWSVVLGTSILARPQYIPLRVFFLSLALYSLNATTIYTSKLINVFTTPAYEHQIDSFDEILGSNIPIGKFAFLLICASLHSVTFPFFF